MLTAVEEIKRLRSRLLEFPEIRNFVDSESENTSNWDLILSFLLLILGIWGHVSLTFGSVLLAVFFTMIQLIGIAGLNSLSHESWHQRSLKWKKAEHPISKYCINPFFIRQFAETVKAHWAHHRYFGTERDPDSSVWRQSPIEYRNNQLRRLLVLPAAINLLKGLLSGKRFNRQKNESSDDAKAREWGVVLVAAVYHLLWIGVLILTSWTSLVLGYFVPMVLGAVLANAREYGEHRFLTDGRLAIYDTHCSTLQRLFISGGYFNLHALHHVFPEIPQRMLPKLYRTIAAHEQIKSTYYGSSPVVRKKNSYLSFESEVS